MVRVAGPKPEGAVGLGAKRYCASVDNAPSAAPAASDPHETAASAAAQVAAPAAIAPAAAATPKDAAPKAAPMRIGTTGKGMKSTGASVGGISHWQAHAEAKNKPTTKIRFIDSSQIRAGEGQKHTMTFPLARPGVP